MRPSVQHSSLSLPKSVMDKDMRNNRIKYSKKRHKYYLKGPANSIFSGRVYNTIMKDLEETLKKEGKINLYLCFTMISGTGIKYLINLFGKLNQLAKRGKPIVVKWIVKEGEKDTYMLGKDLSDFCKFDYSVRYFI